MAEGGFDDIEMREHNEFKQYTDEQLENELTENKDNYDTIDRDFANEKMPDNVRVKYDKITDRITSIKRELTRRNQYRENETSFTDNNDGKTVTITNKGSGDVMKLPSVENIPNVDVPNNHPENDLRTALNRFMRETYDIDLNMHDDNVLEIINNSNIRTGTNNVEYKPVLKNSERGKPHIVLKRNKDGRLIINKTKANEKALTQFLSLIGKISERAKTSEEQPMIDTNPDNSLIPGLTNQENRELQGVLTPNNTIDPTTRPLFLEAQADHFQDTINETENIRDGEEVNSTEEFELNERLIGLETARDRTLEQMELETVREQQEEDITRLQKIKEWFKENWLGASALGITIASFITTIIISARGAIVKGGQALGKLGKAIANLAKQAGPLLSSLLNMVATVLKWGVKGLSWLASNLWILAIALAWFVYNQYKQRK